MSLFGVVGGVISVCSAAHHPTRNTHEEVAEKFK